MGKLERNLPNDAYEAATNANNPSALNPFITEVDAAVTAASLILYPTTAASGVPTYNKLVNAITDPDYDDPAVDLSTGAITGASQLIASLASNEGVISGNPGTVNVNTIGNIRRVSGSGTATFYFEIYHRDNLGTETLIGTSNTTYDASSAVYEQFFASALITGITFGPTDRVVTKWYANRVAGGSNPTYEIQIGGATPVKITFPVPLASLPTGGVDGSGTTNYIPKWTPDGDTLGDSPLEVGGAGYNVGHGSTPLGLTMYTLNTLPLTGFTGQQTGIDIKALVATALINRGQLVLTNNATSRNTGYEAIVGQGATTTTNVGADFAVGSSGGCPIPFNDNDAANFRVLGILTDTDGNNLGPALGAYLCNIQSNAFDNVGLMVNVANAGAGGAYIGLLKDGNEGAGKVLTSDANGYATWQTPAGGGGSAKFNRSFYAYNMTPAGGFSWNGLTVGPTTLTTLAERHRLHIFAGVGQPDGVLVNVTLPNSYVAGADIRVTLKLTANVAGDTFWGVGVTQLSALGAYSNDADTQYVTNTVTMLAAFQDNTSVFVFSGTGMNPGDPLAILVYRDPSNAADVNANDTYLHQILIEEI